MWDPSLLAADAGCISPMVVSLCAALARAGITELDPRYPMCQGSNTPRYHSSRPKRSIRSSIGSQGYLLYIFWGVWEQFHWIRSDFSCKMAVSARRELPREPHSGRFSYLTSKLNILKHVCREKIISSGGIYPLDPSGKMRSEIPHLLACRTAPQ